MPIADLPGRAPAQPACSLASHRPAGNHSGSAVLGRRCELRADGRRRLRLPADLGKLVINGTKVTMQQPRLTGFTIDSRPYEFTAKSAEQDITKLDLMELHQIQAKIEMEDKSLVTISANTGDYNMKSEMLTLHDDIHLLSTTGYEARLSEAVIDVHKGSVVSEKPVWVKLINGVLNAKRLEVLNSGEVIRFGGGVAMTVQPDQLPAQASDR
jgi:lipopolysaccharide export system protein LptC